MTLDEAKKRIKELDSGYSFSGRDYDSGWEDALCRVTEILDEIDTEPVGNPDKLTLTELAHGLRRLFRFKYLTAHEWHGCIYFCMFIEKPKFNGDTWLWSKPYTSKIEMQEQFIQSLDLSEYADENGEIDYSRCIVEVSDDAE